MCWLLFFHIGLHLQKLSECPLLYSTQEMADNHGLESIADVIELYRSAGYGRTTTSMWMTGQRPGWLS